MFTLTEFEAALAIVRTAVPQTPQYSWPLLNERTGLALIVKHESHTPVGSFKVRGGLIYVDRLRREQPGVKSIIGATKGNHGQSLAFAGRRAGLSVTIVVPHGNAVEKNAAMRAFGATLIEHGQDFDEARAHAIALAGEQGLALAPNFSRDLVIGVASYAYEFLSAEPTLDVVYVPVGIGSAICALIAMRALLSRSFRIVGVVSEHANAYAQAFKTGQRVQTGSPRTIADGLATRATHDEALAIIRAGADDIVEVSDHEIANAIRLLLATTHSLAEGAGAAALAGALKEAAQLAGKKVGVILTGQNIDTTWLRQILSGTVPVV